jgi:hypothetical protein
MKSKIFKPIEALKTLDGKVITADEAKEIRRKYLAKKKKGHKPTPEEKLLDTQIRLLLSHNSVAEKGNQFIRKYKNKLS